MAKQKYWDGTKWVQVAPSMPEFNGFKTEFNNFKAEKGKVNGIATLGANGRVLNRQLGYHSPSNAVIKINENIREREWGEGIENYRSLTTFTVPNIGTYRITFDLFTDGLSEAPSQYVTFYFRIINSSGKVVSPEYSAAFQKIYPSEVKKVTLDTFENVGNSSQLTLQIRTIIGGNIAVYVNVNNPTLRGAI